MKAKFENQHHVTYKRRMGYFVELSAYLKIIIIYLLFVFFCVFFWVIRALVWMQISDEIQKKYASSELWKFLSLGYALMLCPFIIVLGGMFFLATALFFLDDREKAEQ